MDAPSTEKTQSHPGLLFEATVVSATTTGLRQLTTSLPGLHDNLQKEAPPERNPLLTEDAYFVLLGLEARLLVKVTKHKNHGSLSSVPLKGETHLRILLGVPG